ncbi:hypothetical protein SERLADRAFT_364779 [Serpula lacrymans var. lacrymans S7.9]|uniref:Uncharacterized protein n=2 Tax=Serpula lacrymans var. lacrymans TaxID=341189 RepID=F8NG77_SERL9|nr:uncharacterized protein SERLADRAFT_364779 [Serpula lacrymans var. lacrymans S7.9]EGO31047.1 hypothetical protein SERLADRAFT_364779 [Serpula lacrymans var. lacrymans S7.9]
MDDVIPDLHNLAPIYLFLLIAGGQVGLPIIAFTYVFSKRISRCSTIINYCVTWIIYSVVYSLYFYGGGRKASQQLCVVQASLIQGAPPMAVVASLSVVISTWSTFHWQDHDHPFIDRIPRPLWFFMILAPPYIVLFMFSLAFGLFNIGKGLARPTNGLYCSIWLEPDSM